MHRSGVNDTSVHGRRTGTLVSAAALEVAYGSASALPGYESPRRFYSHSLCIYVLVRRRAGADVSWYGDVSSYSGIWRRATMLFWMVWSDDLEVLLGVSRGSGDPTWSLSTLSIVWAMTSRGFGDETGGTMAITTRCSWLIAVVGTFLLYSWPYIQSFGIYIFGYASIRYYGFLELLSRNATKYEDYRSISSTCSNGVTLERPADGRRSYGGL